MPSTRELVSIVKEDYAPDWSRSKILSFLNRVQRYLVKNDCAQTVWLDEEDSQFPFPFLKTQAGQLSYEMKESNFRAFDNAHTVEFKKNGYAVAMRRIRHCFITVASLSNSNYDRKFFGEQFNLTGINEYWSQRLYRTSYYKVPGDIRDPDGVNPYPRFIFHEDPGTHDDRYLVEMFFDPVPLTTEDIPLSIDGDQWERELIDGVVGWIEDAENGKSGRLERFLKQHRRKFTNYMNDHANERREPQMPIRECL